ncbi:Lateral organ boundaries, LOB [Dillenia turbinata]|uniref:Lateral organ boundaries, LOB n=1 Tax=Dillenia turbinata TaxID=194707 RepID=A0AAN8UFK9_9MAGN
MSIPRVGNGTQACAACRHQRRKCAPDCILAPFFPHDRQRQFLNAHKLFGVSNITKIIRDLDPHQKEEAMRTIIIQSDVRASDPVGGCYKIILDLQCQIEYNKAELDLVLHQLAICRAQAQAQTRAQQIQIPEPDTALTCDSLNADPLDAYNPIQYQQLQQQEEQFVIQENHNLQDVASWVMQDASASTLQIKQAFVNEYDDIKPLFVISG